MIIIICTIFSSRIESLFWEEQGVSGCDAMVTSWPVMTMTEAGEDTPMGHSVTPTKSGAVELSAEEEAATAKFLENVNKWREARQMGEVSPDQARCRLVTCNLCHVMFGWVTYIYVMSSLDEWHTFMLCQESGCQHCYWLLSKLEFSIYCRQTRWAVWSCAVIVTHFWVTNITSSQPADSVCHECVQMCLFSVTMAIRRQVPHGEKI